jgi:lipoprotein
MKNLKNFAAAAIMMVLCAALSVSFVSCSGTDIDMNKRQEPIKPEVSTKVDDTYINHDWAERENSFVDEATSVTKYTDLGQQKSFEIELPATISWSVEEVLRTSKTFDAAEITLSEEVEDIVDEKSLRDTLIFSHDRVITEKFAETSIEMNTRWLNGHVFIAGEKSQLAYVSIDSIKAMPEQTTVKFIEMADEANKIERDSFYMPHKAYYTEYSIRGKKNIVKDFTVAGTFLFKQESEEPEEPGKETIEDAEYVNRWFDMDEKKSYMTLNCTWNNGEKEQLTFWVSMPFGWEFPKEWSKNVSSEGPSKFVSLVQDANPSMTEFSEVKNTNETNGMEHGIVYRRKISSKTNFKFTDFDEILSSFHHESYIKINGKDFQFLSPSESIAQGVHAQNTTANGNISTEKNTVKAEITFNQQLFHASGIVNILREVKQEPTDPEEPETPTDPETPEEPENPTPDNETIPSEWGEITGVVGVTRIVETIGNNDYWHTCLTLRTTKGQIRVIDKNWKTVTNAFMSFDQIYDDNRMTSGAYRNGTVYPAMVTIDGNGWVYTAETKTGINFAVNMTDQRAVTGGIKNFTKDNTAKPTPIVQHNAEFKTVNGKKILTVTCYNVDDKVTDIFTINCIPSAN